jgi:hypothetical protein
LTHAHWLSKMLHDTTSCIRQWQMRITCKYGPSIVMELAVGLQTLILHSECLCRQVLAQSYESTQQLTEGDYARFRNILAKGRAARVCQAEE